MGKFSRLGNDLYTGRRSIDFVGRKWLWYAVSAVIVVAGRRRTGRPRVSTSASSSPAARSTRVTLPADQVTQDTADELRVGGGRHRHRERRRRRSSPPRAATRSSSRPSRSTDAESAQVVRRHRWTSTGATEADISQTEIGASWGKEVAQRSLIGLVVFLVLVVLFIWAYFREWKMSVAALVALAHDVADHGRRLRAVRASRSRRRRSPAC